MPLGQDRLRRDVGTWCQAGQRLRSRGAAVSRVSVAVTGDASVAGRATKTAERADRAVSGASQWQVRNTGCPL